MLRKIGLAIALILVAIGCRASGKGSSAERQDGYRAPVKLLPGFKWTLIPGIDSPGATISNNDGLEIGVELCCGFGVETEDVSKSMVLWREEQTVNGERVLLVFTKSKELIVSFPLSTAKAINFHAKIHNQRDMAEMLLMVLTYQGPPYRRSSCLTCSPSTIPLPNTGRNNSATRKEIHSRPAV